MSEIKNIFSSGGVGDTWICFLKILPFTNTHNINWVHVNSHECHLKPIGEIQSWMPKLINNGNIKINGMKDLSKYEREFALQCNHKFIRLNTKANEIAYPCLNLSNTFVSKTKFLEEPYIVIQGRAGRKDNSSREITEGCLLEAIRSHKNKKVVLLGMESDKISKDFIIKFNIMDLRGQGSLRNSLCYIRHCDYFCGFDGILCYMAMTFMIPSTVIFHLPQLPEHYMNSEWRHNTDVMIYERKDYNSPTVLNSLDDLIKV